MDKFAELLPESCYDLIARIPPGAVLCAALAWHVRQRVPVTELDPVYGFPVALMASYLAGFLLDAVSAMILGGFASLIVEIFAKLGTRVTPLKVWQVDVRKRLIAGVSERHRTKFTKVLAESVMARSLVTLVAGMWISYLAPMAGFSFLAKASLLLGLVACWGQAEFNLRRILRDDLSLRKSEVEVPPSEFMVGRRFEKGWGADFCKWAELEKEFGCAYLKGDQEFIIEKGGE
jgi:hypothetical protein